MISNSHLNRVINVIKSGGIIAYPTESVFGLGCDPFNQKAVKQLLLLKQRPVEKGLILIASHIDQILSLIRPQKANDLARALKTWPGHHTWVFPKSDRAPSWITGNYNSLAVRLSKHPTVLQLCNRLGHALVSTSANISNQQDLNSIKAIKLTFGDKIQCYIDAPTGNKKMPSTIRDAHTLKIIR